MDEYRKWLENEIRVEAERLLEFARFKGLCFQEIKSEERMNALKDALEKYDEIKK